jgi:protein-S-isoprenylcysteine O-methyltransferase Ste14
MDSGRYGWSGAVPLGVTVAGALLMLAGQLLFALARRENGFFSSTVRLQAEFGHVVCRSGPYRYVRHPGYLGLLASQLGFPLLMNSWSALVPAAVGVALLLARELAGYADYATQTRWRLLPGLF